MFSHEDGGGVYLSSSSAFVIFTSCTLDSNTARTGGFAYVNTGRLKVTHSAITNGMVKLFGAVVYNSEYNSDEVSISSSIISDFCLPDEAECYDSENGATSYFGHTCHDYTLSIVECGDADDADFTAAHMCCACGGGSTAFVGTHSLVYHASSTEVILLDSLVFRNNGPDALFAEHERSVVLRNCEGLTASDVQSATSLVNCDIQSGYCLADYCADTTTGFEVREMPNTG